MKTRKVISAILAGACAISALGFSATAADTKNVSSTGNLTLKATAAGATVTINVTVPSKIASVINPYGVSITDKSAGKVDEFGVVSPVYEILNNDTETAVKVSVAPYAVLATKKVSGSGEDAEYDYSGVAWKDSDVVETDEGKQINAFVIGYSDMNKILESTANPFTEKSSETGKYTKGLSSKDTNSGKYGTIVPFTDCSKIKDGGKAAPVPDGVPFMIINPSDGTKVSDADKHKHVAACYDGGKLGEGDLQCKFKDQEGDGKYADDTSKKPGDVIGNAGQFQIRGTASKASDWSSSDKATLNVVFSFGVCDAAKAN